MVFNTISNIEKPEKGITLVELVVVILIIATFSMILISDFPKILKQYALSRVTYKLSQDFRKIEDLGLSGLQITDKSGNPVLAKGYGVYVNRSLSITKYLVYADVNGNQKYDGDFSTLRCDDPNQLSVITSDCLIEDVVDVSKENSSLVISGIGNIGVYSYTSVNFSPPNPTVTIDNISTAGDPVTINLSNGFSTRTVLVNKSGLINVQ